MKSWIKKHKKLYKSLIDLYNYKIYYFNRRAIKKSREDFVRKFYKKYHNKEIDLVNPKTFNEKLNWLKLYWFDPKATQCVDKYEVRKYVAEKGFENILNDLCGQGVYEHPNDINIEELPNQFVLKPTHDSGHVITSTNKNELDWENIKKSLRRWLKINYGYMSGEWPYINVNRRIICEQYLKDNYRQELVDYRIFCFSGEPKLIQVDMDYSTDHKRNFYNTKWEKLNLVESFPNELEENVQKPEKLDEMLDIAKVLSKEFPFVRVDFFYTTSNKIIFAELTFFPKGGTNKFIPQNFDLILGDYLKLPQKVVFPANMNKV